MRTAFLDEAGTDNQAARLVVAGVILDPDRHYVAARDQLNAIARSTFPDVEPSSVIFHAKDLMNGHGVFARIQTQDERHQLLEKVASIPSKIGLPIVYGFTDKEMPADVGAMKTTDKVRNFYSMAFGLCLIAVERFMREHAREGELATITAEDLPEARAQAKQLHRTFSDSRAAHALFGNVPDVIAILPLRRIVDTVQFAGKRESLMLQLADVCGYALSRWANGRKNGDHLYRVLTGAEPPTFAFDVGAASQMLIPVQQPSFARLAWDVSPYRVRKP